MLTNLLAGFPWKTVLLWTFVIGAIVALYFFNRRAQLRREEEVNKTLNALKPGCKVKTIGGICGIIVELCPDDNTFILETGSENSGKSYIKFDMKAIYQTDALEQAAPVQEEAPQIEGEAPFEEVAEAPVEPVVEEAPVEEAPVEEAPVEPVVEAPAKKSRAKKAKKEEPVAEETTNE